MSVPYQLIPEPPVEPLTLSTIDPGMFDAHKLMYQFGYRGGFTTTSHDDNGVITESGRFDMVLEGAVPIDAALGDTILYRLTPSPHVVRCVTPEEFSKYQSV